MGISPREPRDSPWQPVAVAFEDPAEAREDALPLPVGLRNPVSDVEDRDRGRLVDLGRAERAGRESYGAISGAGTSGTSQCARRISKRLCSSRRNVS